MNGLRVIMESCFTDLVPLLIATAVGGVLARRRCYRFVGLLVLYVITDNFIALTPIIFHWKLGQWNWIGQGAALMFGLFVGYRSFEKQEIDLRLPRTQREWMRTGGGVLPALAIAIGPALFGQGTHPDAETFAYQAILPGPVEELASRGIGMALLLRAFSEGTNDRRAQWIAALATAVWFTSGHVFHLQGGRFQVGWSRVLNVLPMATMYAVTRLRS